MADPEAKAHVATRSRTPTEKAAALILAAVVIGSVQAAGSVHSAVFLIISAAAIGGTAWLLSRSDGTFDASLWAPPALVLTALGLWSALQSVPLPAALVGRIAPHNAEVWARALRPLAESGPSWIPISMDPGGSLLEAAKWATYGVVFLAAARVGRIWSGTSGPVLVFVSGALVALVTLVHGLLGAKTLFGVYAPRFATPNWGVSPLLNPNNLSGYLNLGALCGVGLLITRRPLGNRWPFAGRVPVAAGVALMVASSALAASRGGILALGFGVIAIVLLTRLLRNDSNPAPSRTALGALRNALPAAIGLGGGLLLAVAGASSATWEELNNTSAEKARLIAWTAPVIRDHPWLGIGRGAFETVFPAYRPGPGHVVFTHPENFIVQWLVEWGIPVSVLALVGLAWLLRPSKTGMTRNRAALAACVGVAVLLVQNLADLALEVPGVAIGLAALLGALTGGARGKRHSPPPAADRPWAARLRARSPLAVLSLAALFWISAVSFARSPAVAERTRFHERFAEQYFVDAASFEPFKRELRAAMLRHPGDPYFAVLGAAAARKCRGVDPMPWIAAALERDPMNGRAHLLLAEILAARGARRQALMELRFAVEREQYLANPAGKLALRWAKSTEDMLEAAPSGTSGAFVLLAMARELVKPEQRTQRARLLEIAVERDPGLVESRLVRAQDLMSALERREPPCDAAAEAACRTQLEDELARIRALDAGSCVVPMLRARLLELAHDPKAATKTLADGCGSCRDTVACLGARVALASRQDNPTQLHDAITAYIATACATTSACATAHRDVADLRASRQEWASAAEHYDQAAANAPTADNFLRLADAAARAGNSTRANTALRKAQSLGAADATVSERIEKIRQDAHRQPLKDNPE